MKLISIQIRIYKNKGYLSIPLLFHICSMTFLRNLKARKWPSTAVVAMKRTLTRKSWHGQYDISGLQHENGKSSGHFLFVIGFRVNINRALVCPVMKKMDSNFSILPGFPSNMLTRGIGRVAKGVHPRGRCSEGTGMFAISIALVCYYCIIQKDVMRTNSTEIFGNVGIKSYRIVSDLGSKESANKLSLRN